MTTIRIPSALRGYTDGQKEVELPAATVAAALRSLAERFPDLRGHLYDESGGLRSYVNVFLNDTDVRDLELSQNTPLRPTDRLMIVPSIAGGAPVSPSEAFPSVLLLSGGAGMGVLRRLTGRDARGTCIVITPEQQAAESGSQRVTRPCA
jgi:molybdopterin converting factor small subunit